MSHCSASQRAFSTLTAIILALGATAIGAHGQTKNATSKPEEIELFPVPPGTDFERHVVGAGDSEGAVAGGERAIYSNTKGMYAARLPSGYLIADDISTTAAVGCSLTRFKFEVTGQANPALPAAAYTVSWALYDNCPGAVSAFYRPYIMIIGTEGSASFVDGAPRTIEFAPAEAVAIPTSFWLAIRIDGNNAGPILGSPAFEGFSSDIFDFPGFACNANVGRFPAQPHASFNTEFFGNNCAPEHLGYKAQRASGAKFNPGRNIWFADDLQLITDDCKMTAYEIVVKGPGRYDFEIRSACIGTGIAGTQNYTQVPSGLGEDPRAYRFIFDPPIPLPQNPWFAVKINNDTSGAIVAGRQADIGETQDSYGVQLPDGTCDLGDLGPGLHSAFHVSITCEGEAPKGACCDMYVTECVGGPDDGRPCADNDDCTDPGTCESVCREVAEVNCPFPPRFSPVRPQWKEGAACDPGPFEEGLCGQAACCYKDVEGDEYCENLTKNECYAIPPLENEREWQRGRFCSLYNQRCPLNACLARPGSCTEAHDCSGPEAAGCQYPNCCTGVCNEPWQEFCCAVCWDEECALVAQEYCTSGACCDTTPGIGGVCEDDVAEGECVGQFDIWTRNRTCSEVQCEEAVLGACCDRSPGAGGVCTDDVVQADCVGPYLVWRRERLCSNIRCEEAVPGACCDRTPGSGGVCTDDVFEPDCVGSDILMLEGRLCSEITCTDVAAPPTFSLKAVTLNDRPITPTNEVTVAPGDTIETEIRIFGWGYEIPTGVRSYEARITGRQSAVSGGDGMILPLGWNAKLHPTICWEDPDACQTDEFCIGEQCVYPGHNPAMGAYINSARPDFIFAGMAALKEVATFWLNYVFLALAYDEIVLDPGTDMYAGTLKLVASDDACGTFTFTFGPMEAMDTVLGDEDNVPYYPALEPLVIRLDQCILDVCADRDGDCAGSHATPGCNDPQCCTSVCSDPEYDYCCSEDWDGECADFARTVCAFGACCDESPGTGGTCEDYVLGPWCAAEYLVWHEGARCGEIECERGFTPIPTTSEWGLVVLVLALLTAGKVYFRRARCHA